jgi:hypothetical protein
MPRAYASTVEDQFDRITTTFLDFAETPESKIFPNQAFGYWKLVVERPLRLHSRLTLPAIEKLRFGPEHAPLLAILGVRLGLTDRTNSDMPGANWATMAATPTR